MQNAELVVSDYLVPLKIGAVINSREQLRISMKNSQTFTGKCAGGRSTARARGAPRARPERSAPLHGFRAAARHPPVANPTARAFEALQVPSEM